MSYMKIISKIKNDNNLKLKNPVKAHPDIGTCRVFQYDQTILEINSFYGPNGPNLNFNLMPCCDKKYKDKKIIDKTLILNPRFCDNYGHILHDNIPEIIFAEEDSRYDAVFMPSSALLKEIIGLLDLNLNKVKLIENQMYFKSRTIHFKNSFTYPEIDISKTRRFKQLIEKNLATNSSAKNLIYYSRSKKDALNGRIMDEKNETEVIEILKKYANYHNLNFCIFNGQLDGKRMSTDKQIELFRSAKMLVGPHGSGMSNCIWINPKNNCKICEFTCGTEKLLQQTGAFFKNYNFFYSGLIDEMFDYYLIPFSGESTDDIVSIDIENLLQFLYHSENK